jgi:hypothetical protein
MAITVQRVGRHLVDSHTCGQQISLCTFMTSRHITPEHWKTPHFQGQQQACLSGLKVMIYLILSLQ